MHTSDTERSSSVADRLLGLVGGGMIIAAVALLIFGGGPRDTGATGPPSITVMEPVRGEVVEGPVALVFRVPVRLQRGPGGWGTGQLHLHVAVDSMEFMPGADDIQPLGGDRYRWVLRGVSPGTHAIRLFWSGPDHRAIPDGASVPLSIEVRGAGDG